MTARSDRTTSRNRRWFRSTRFRITAPATAITAAIVGIGSLVLVVSVHDHLLSQVDRSLAAEADFIRHQLDLHHIPPTTGPHGQLGQIFLADGRLVGSSANLAHQPPLIQVRPYDSRPRYLTIENREFGQVRIIETQLGTGDAPILVDGQQVDQVSAATNSLAIRLVLVGPILVLVFGILIWLVVGRAMRPVDTVRREAAQMSEADLDRRIDNPRTGDELERLVDTLNALLQRISVTIDRQHRFVADASHEFRSPIASIRATVEAEMGTASTPTEAQRAILRGVQRLQDLADQLLVLDEAGRDSTEKDHPVDLDELVFAEVEKVASSTGVVVDASEVSGGQVLGQELDFTRIIDNLTSNALRHARRGIAFSVSESDGMATISVGDDGPGVPAELRHLIFEPFRRLDADRGRGRGGTGLGLAIVSELTEKYHGTVRVDQDPELLGAKFTVTLPVAGRSSPRPDRVAATRDPRS